MFLEKCLDFLHEAHEAGRRSHALAIACRLYVERQVASIFAVQRISSIARVRHGHALRRRGRGEDTLDLAESAAGRYQRLAHVTYDTARREKSGGVTRQGRNRRRREATYLPRTARTARQGGRAVRQQLGDDVSIHDVKIGAAALLKTLAGTGGV